ncbi:MAG: 2-amino-4-hydroxy-6-hydroxymethyldihydropteridine diphosphokinase [Cyanobium sp. PLM2.Bin73]|nr:MAG: 2-amino-4-hydroxy-6-hydroxymethyldihydropteridine diphosphokinase [Cyanobium sp. PLM2.Bin73]
MERSSPCVVCASLADQAQAPADGAADLAIALGANLPSQAGPPLATLLAVRPLLVQLLADWQAAFADPGGGAAVQLIWSPLFRTVPVGGPVEQPPYLNAVLLVRAAGSPGCAAAGVLLERLHELERRFGRQRRQRWGPRSLDLDLLWWGALRCRGGALELPHPRWRQRAFVLAPLAAIAAARMPPEAKPTAGAAGGEPLAGLLAEPLTEPLIEPLSGADDPPPLRLAGRSGWPE